MFSCPVFWNNSEQNNNDEMLSDNNIDHLMALYPGQPRWTGTRTLRNITTIYHRRCPQIHHKHAQPSLSGLPDYLYCLILGRTRWKQLTERNQGKEPTLLYAILILVLKRPLANCWSPLTHACHCMTTSTSRPTAATQTSPIMHPKVFLCRVENFFQNKDVEDKNKIKLRSCAK